MVEHAKPAAASQQQDAKQRHIVRKLGSWYDRHKRDLPWRRNCHPYAVWVSEIMLQQTRVETVKPYFVRFMADFPTVAELAAAELDEVLKRWQGLGYYRRARLLHAAACEVVENHGGELPRSAAELQQLSGIGRYTAGAVASIAFDQAEAIVDGNVKRVLARLFGFEQDMRSSAGKRWAWQQAEKLVPRRRPGRFNQAMMELGATVCTPKTPSCRGCPLSSVCEAHHTGRSHQLPYLAPRKAPTTVRLTAVVCGHGERRWLARRAPDGLFGGMWEPPMVQHRGNAARSALVRLLGGGVSSDVSLRAAGRVEHVLSHRKLDVAVLVAQVTKPETIGGLGVDQPDYDELRWCAPEQVALSALARKVLAVAEVVA